MSVFTVTCPYCENPVYDYEPRRTVCDDNGVMAIAHDECVDRFADLSDLMDDDADGGAVADDELIDYEADEEVDDDEMGDRLDDLG